MDSSVRERLAALTADQRHRLKERLAPSARRTDNTDLRFSLFFFGHRNPSENGLYDLVFESATIADARGLWAVWTPERHFNEFGGAFPEPAILAAAIAARTKRLRVRAGSVVLPVNDTARVVERWSVVDHISGGRAGVSFASGWHPADFALARKPYEQRHESFAHQLSEFELLWKGGTTTIGEPSDDSDPVRIYPKPVQAMLPIWITCSRAQEPWRLAARLGHNVLTGLMEQSIDELETSIKLYRSELHRHGHDPAARQVTLMMHTYVGADDEDCRAVAGGALSSYLGAHIKFYETMVVRREFGIAPNLLTSADRLALVDRGLARYLDYSSLVGTLEECVARSRKLLTIGVDEIAALVDFGLPDAKVLEGVGRLADLAAVYARR